MRSPEQLELGDKIKFGGVSLTVVGTEDISMGWTRVTVMGLGVGVAGSIDLRRDTRVKVE